jgi:cell division protein FtsI (penicillin-binding protein 3)
MTTSNKRVLQLFAFVAAWALVVVGRLVQVQLVRHDDYMNRAVRQQERTIVLNPVRGSILDVRGRVLAESVAAESIYADTAVLDDLHATARTIASVAGLQMTPAEVEEKLKAGGVVVIARQVPVEVTAQVKTLKVPGIYYIEEHRRSYPKQQLAANVVGYVGMDGAGLAGIEHSFDPYVRGRAGKVTLLRDARRGMYLVGGEGANRAVDGQDVVLTIDSVVQFITERALGRMVDKYHATSGTAIVMDPADGSILAMASLPTFDPNRFGDFGPASWRNRAVQDMYEPGSTFKIVTASAGLEEGLVTPSQMIDCGAGSIQIGNVSIHEHGHNRYGVIPFEEVLVHSSNVGTIRVGLALGPDRFYRYIRRFGFGQRTGIELPGEAGGLVRRVDKWSQLSNASMSIGQEIGVTPLQILRAAAAVANGGMMVEPRIVDRVVNANGETVYRPPHHAPQRVVSARTTAVLNEILKAVVARGTGSPAGLVEHVVAGKTGTAQKAGRGGYSPDKFVASFAGYVPADRPRLVILVAVDEPKGAQYGGTVAAPAFKEIAESTLRYLGVAPSIPARTVGVNPMLLAAFSQSRANDGGAVLASTAIAADGIGVPDFRGLDARAAIAKATARGLMVDADGSGVVTSQKPLAGEALPAGRHVELTFGAQSAASERATGGNAARVKPLMRPVLAATRALRVANVVTSRRTEAIR